MENSNFKNSKVRIGARILGDKALDKLLPSNKNIIEQIEDTRRSAQLYNLIKLDSSKQEKWDREFDRHFNNIFSILGGRGSGKTSVLLTMKYIITEKYKKKNENNANIILPLIVPEKMGSTSDILGSIIGFLGDEIENIKNEEKNRNKSYLYNGTETFLSCRKNIIDVIDEKYNDLLKQYMYTKQDYRTILIDQYDGFMDYVKNAKNILDSDQKLIVKFEEFTEELLNTKRNLNNLDSRNLDSRSLEKNEPLIFIFFDDVDLSTERCSEILNVILRYLSHPNIIVFVTGNYRTFSEVLTINALKKDDLLNEQMGKCFFSETIKDIESALEVRKILTQDLLKKILPPAFRYNMPIMDERSKAGFIFSTEADNDDEQKIAKGTIEYFSLFELIIKNFIDMNYEKKDQDSNEYKKSFLYYNDEPIYAYFKIFDDTQRGTMNAYYFLYSTLSLNVTTENADMVSEETRCIRIKRLLSTLVQSSSVLNKYENEIKRIIDLRDSFENTFVDYKYIESMLEERKNDNLIDDAIIIFMLANFIENIVVLENKKIHKDSRRKVHGADVLCKILNSQNKKILLYPNTKDLKMLLQMYTKISMRVPSSNIKNLSDDKKKDYFLGKYFEVIDEIKGDKRGNSLEFFGRLYFEDSKWVRRMIEMIMHHGGGIKIVLSHNIEELYSRIKGMRVEEETLDKIKNKLEEIVEQCKENSDSYIIEQILNVNKFKNTYKNGKQTNNIAISQIEDLIEECEDKLLFYQNRYKSAVRKYKISSEIKEKYQEIIKEIDMEKSGSFPKRIEAYLGDDYIYEDEYKQLEHYVKIFSRQTIRNNGPWVEEKIIGLRTSLEIVGKQIQNVEWIDSELIVEQEEFIKECIDFVKLKSLYEIRLRETAAIETDKVKENFHAKFQRLKKELMCDQKGNKYQGFTEYIKEKERESSQVNLNVFS